MTQFLPPNLLALFAPRDAIPYKQPVKALTWEKDRERAPYTGISQYVNLFEDSKDTPPPTRGETKEEKKIRKIREKLEKRNEDIEEEVKTWDPHNDPNAGGDAFKTLFVSRINYDTTESKLRREFEMYGKIRKVTMVKDIATGKPRGYAFIEYERERDMHTAYKSGDGKKIDNRRVLVDVERGRTVKGWRPRRLGGGLGSTRAAPTDDAARRTDRNVVNVVNVLSVVEVIGKGKGREARESQIAIVTERGTSEEDLQTKRKVRRIEIELVIVTEIVIVKSVDVTTEVIRIVGIGNENLITNLRGEMLIKMVEMLEMIKRKKEVETKSANLGVIETGTEIDQIRIKIGDIEIVTEAKIAKEGRKKKKSHRIETLLKRNTSQIPI
uniref:U1 small nuclear ribonucleoprotein 70 kDa n=1 Tax=Ciona savignyi TaxID=51511 RepID=H2ZHW0_CIOSA